MMLGTLANVAFVLLGSLAGLFFRSRLSERLCRTIMQVLGLCVLGIGIKSAIGTGDVLCVIVCMVLGTLLGEWIDLEKRLDGIGERIRRRVEKGGGESRFTEGFVTASVLYCVGSMAIMGALEAGIQGSHAILIAKGVIDGITALTFAAAMGAGVAFSVLPILIYQGGLTLLASVAAPWLSVAAVTEMSAVGGTIIIGIAINMLSLRQDRLRVGNMLPAIFLPLLYLPIASRLTGIF